MKSSPNKKTVIAVATALTALSATVLGVSASSASFAATSNPPDPNRHVIKIYPDPNSPTTDPWSAFARLKSADGNNNIYTWSESHPGATDNIRWEYTDGKDGAYIDLTISPSDYSPDIKISHLSLAGNHCYHITRDHQVTEIPNCPFN